MPSKSISQKKPPPNTKIMINCGRSDGIQQRCIPQKTPPPEATTRNHQKAQQQPNASHRCCRRPEKKTDHEALWTCSSAACVIRVNTWILQLRQANQRFNIKRAATKPLDSTFVGRRIRIPYKRNVPLLYSLGSGKDALRLQNHWM